MTKQLSSLLDLDDFNSVNFSDLHECAGCGVRDDRRANSVSDSL